MQCLFATTYMSAGHAPKATDLPFGATGSSPVLAAAEKTISLKVTRYPDEQAAKTAIDQARIWGALITSGTSSTLIVVPSISDLAPLDLAVRFQDAAKSTGQKITVQQYAPVPLPARDPFGLVQGLMLIPLLIGRVHELDPADGRDREAAARWRAAQLAGFAIAAGLAVDLIVCLWLQGYASSKFWITWPICSLIIAAVAFVAAGAAEADRGRGHAADHHRGHLVRQPLIRRGQRGAVPSLPGGYRAVPAAPQRATSCCTTRSTSTATEPLRP